MTVKELIKLLEPQPQDAQVIMCMDWTENVKHPEKYEQWEDDLGEVASTHDRHGKWGYLLNKNFK